jgi:hypothetical protein
VRGPTRISDFRRILIRAMLLVCGVDVLISATSAIGAEAADAGVPTTTMLGGKIVYGTAPESH